MSQQTQLDSFFAFKMSKQLNYVMFIKVKGIEHMYLYTCIYINVYLYFHWQVYSDRYVDQMGIIGYFPATMVKETYKFAEDTVMIPTTVSTLVNSIGTFLR